MPIKGKFIFQSTGKSIITLTKDRVNLDFNISCVNGKTFYCKFNPYPALMYIAACKTVMCTCYFLLFQQWHPFGEGLNAFFVVLSLSWQKDIHKKMPERHDVVWVETKKDNWNRMRSANHWDQKRSCVSGFCCLKIRRRWASRRENTENHWPKSVGSGKPIKEQNCLRNKLDPGNHPREQTEEEDSGGKYFERTFLVCTSSRIKEC